MKKQAQRHTRAVRQKLVGQHCMVNKQKKIKATTRTAIVNLQEKKTAECKFSKMLRGRSA